MTASAVFFGLIGLGLTFIPAEIAGYLFSGIHTILVLPFQLLGAAYLGFAMLNWMNRKSPIGGIYAKPLSMANLIHFLVSALALIKMMAEFSTHYGIMLAVTILYSLFTFGFIRVFMTNPKMQ